MSGGGNIRTALSPGQIKDVVFGVGKKVKSENRGGSEGENCGNEEKGGGGGEKGEGKQKEKKWTLKKETFLEVGDLRDAEWEVRDLLKSGIKEKVLEEVFGDKLDVKGMEGRNEGKERIATELMFDAVQAATDAVGGVENVRCMRAWSGVFVSDD